jgi:23S rRNA pseudouridine1911/1915/1917 synthase
MAGMVLWEDERIVALNKPPGVSLATRRSEPGEAVRRLVAAIPDDERAAAWLDPDSLFLIHRLDVGTSGVVLLARDEEAHACLAAAFAARKVDKAYLALVWGKPRPREGRWEWPLGPDRKDRRRMKVDPAGRPSASRYHVVATAPHVSLVELHPETGRTHQLRVHLAHAGHLIVGDDLYGGPRHHAVRNPSLRKVLQPDHPFLHARRIGLPRTACTQELILTAPLPQDFQEALLALGMVPPEEGD